MSCRPVRAGRWAASLLILLILTLTAAAGCRKAAPTAPSDTGTVTTTDLVVGTGLEATNFRTIVVHYTGWLYDASQPDGKGSKFDSSVGGSPFTFVLGAGSVIKGWDLGIVGMKVGGSRRLVIPPSLAYGAAGAGNGVIPPNATLVFDVQLLGVA